MQMVPEISGRKESCSDTLKNALREYRTGNEKPLTDGTLIKRYYNTKSCTIELTCKNGLYTVTQVKRGNGKLSTSRSTFTQKELAVDLAESLSCIQQRRDGTYRALKRNGRLH